MCWINHLVTVNYEISFHLHFLNSDPEHHKCQSKTQTKLASSIIIIVQVLVASEARMLGLDTGNPEADAEAEMWIAGLLGEY